MENSIRDWVATRSGESITLVGMQDGKSVKLTNISSISAGKPFPIATDWKGKKYQLGSSSHS